MELYVALSLLSALLALILSTQIYKLDVNKSYNWFIPVLISTGVWAAFFGIRFLTPDEYSIWALKISFLGIITLPVFLIFFALDYIKSTWLEKTIRNSWLLWIIPAVSVLLMLTNNLHGLFWSETITRELFPGKPIKEPLPGFWFWVHSVYSYVLVVLAAVILFVTLKKKKERLGQYALLLGILLPLTTSILYVSGLVSIDFSPLMLSATVLAVGWAISSRFYMRNIRDVTILQQKTNELNKLHNLVVRLSEKLIQSDPAQLDETINDVLKALGTFTRVDRTYLFSYDEDTDEVHNTYEWCNEGIPSEKENLQNIPFKEAVPRWKKILMDEKHHIYIPQVRDLPDEPIYADERQILEPQGIQSLIVVPMYYGKRFMGFAGFDSVRLVRKWDDESIALLKVCAGVIAGSLERTRYEKELIATLEKAEEANRAKSEFLASMSHELRTPLNAILGFTSVVMEDLEDEKAREQLDLVLTSGNSLLQLLNDLLDFTKAKAGILQLEPRPTQLDAVLDFIKKTFMPKIKEKGLDMQVEITPAANGSFLLDDSRLRQILFNMVGNAVKFTHKGHVKITADAIQEKGTDQKPDSDPRNTIPRYTLYIKIRDTGIGIHEKDQENIFALFTQLSSGLSRQYEGTGLGLNISQRLVQMMGGEILLESTPGEGSVFTVKLTGVLGRR